MIATAAQAETRRSSACWIKPSTTRNRAGVAASEYLVEDYLARDPALSHDAEAILDLIYQEYVLRRDEAKIPIPTSSIRTVSGSRRVAHAPVRRGCGDPTDRASRSRTTISPTTMSTSRSRHIDGYRDLARVLGRGGMGVVYKARDLKLGRIVAIKTIAEGRYATPDQLERFRAEAHAVARLRHPNIIAIHAIGEHEGRPYLSLEFAEGGSLAQRLAEKPMAPREAAALVETLARAVHAAHQAGVIHRDLKPSNVLLTAEGVPKVSDFGLAKLLDADSGRTLLRPGRWARRATWPPSRPRATPSDVGPAADIYALGAILYQALTGRPPFLGESALETIKLVTSTEAVPPRRLRPDVPRDLETICLKCLEKEPRKRYATALALADDLRRFLDDRPIAARPVNSLERSWRWCHRNPRLAGVSATLVATVLIAAAAVTGLTYRHNIQLRAEVKRTESKAAEASRNYQHARSTIRAMLDRLNDRRLAGSARLLGAPPRSAGRCPFVLRSDPDSNRLKRPNCPHRRSPALGEASELSHAAGDDAKAATYAGPVRPTDGGPAARTPG